MFLYFFFKIEVNTIATASSTSTTTTTATKYDNKNLKCNIIQFISFAMLTDYIHCTIFIEALDADGFLVAVVVIVVDAFVIRMYNTIT